MELESSGYNLGCRAMWKRLKKVHNLTVKRQTVMMLMRIIDLEGVEARSRYKLKRRIYNAPGKNFMWHAEYHDKLKKFGFICIDVSRTNNDRAVIGHYFLKAIEKLGFLPTVIRTDLGTEATLKQDFQRALRYMHEDEYSGTKNCVTGRSTRN